MRKVARGPALVVMGVMLLQAAWILTVPPFRGIDEVDHAFRAAAVGGGEWRAGAAAEDGRGYIVTVPGALVEAAHEQCEWLDYTGPDNCSPVDSARDGQVHVASAAARYPPAFYWLVGGPARAFDGADSLYAMRVGTALLSLVLVSMAIWAVSKVPGRWPLAGLIVAATPVFLYSTTVAAPNGVEMSAGLALWSALLALSRGQQRALQTKLLWVAIVAAVVLGALRILGPLFIVLIIGTALIANWSALSEVARTRTKTFVAAALLAGASVMVQAWWMLEPVLGAVGSEEPDNPTSFSAVNIIVWPLQAIAAFPTRNEAGAPIVYPVVLILVLGLLVVALKAGSIRQRIAIGVAIAITLALPYVFTLATLDSIGAIWQGRYGLPYGVGFVLLAGVALGRSRPTAVLPWRISVAAGVAYWAASAACLLKIRSYELTGNVASSTDPAWHAPAPVLLVVVTGVASALFVLALSYRNRATTGGSVDLIVPDQLGASRSS